MALSAIGRNKVRSFLTALGIVIGVASIISMVQIGQATTQSVSDQLSEMGTNLLIVVPGRARRGRGRAQPFTPGDVAAIRNEIYGIHVAPTISAGNTLIYGNRNHDVAITGTTNDFLAVRNREIESGRAFSDRELRSGAPVCLLGKTVVETLYGRVEPLGTSLRVGRIACRVVGVLASKGTSFGGDDDDIVLMPIKAVQRRILGRADIGVIYISATVDGTTQRVEADLTKLLRQRRPPAPDGEDNFRVRDLQQFVENAKNVTTALTVLLSVIAAVSLLVGGIGIMNIMLVSVTERTREIGLRLAIGARARDVLRQFLIEAIAVSSLGGILGVALGVGGTWAATAALELPFVFSPVVVLVGFSFSAAIGVIFGFLPARKAARLNPIEALRHE
jgi:putative ABC transport system permease protein